MGNFSGRKANSEEYDNVQAQVSSGYHAGMVHPSHNSTSAHQLPLMFTPQVPVGPYQNPNHSMQMERLVSNEPTRYQTVVIRWIHEGTRVAIEGSWDNWKTREFLEPSGSEFSIVKVLSVGFHLYRYNVDGQWTYAPELPNECDSTGNVFNVFNLKFNFQDSQNPSSPISSYNNAAFTLEDLNEKPPELPPLLQQTPLDQPAASRSRLEALQYPLSVNLNHLYIQGGHSNRPFLALSSSHRFRSKFVSTVLYTPVKKVRN